MSNYCPHCGTHLREDSRLCQNCGAPLRQIEKKDSEESNIKEKREKKLKKNSQSIKNILKRIGNS